MIVTNVGLCKQFMSRAGWSLFANDMKHNPNGESFNVLIEPEDTGVTLSKLETKRYEYNSSRRDRDTASSPFRYIAETNTVEQIDGSGDVISKHTPCPSEKWAWEQLAVSK
ncbi:hypothetical protein VCHA53O466_140048 [Vibrio chagasii]|nr:hypothetical protein VCHA53O466_140048 [Vibrio chagasii]